MHALRAQLSWTHYRHLIRIDNHDKSDFYLAEVDNNPTIGILLCADKNDAVVKITLPEDNRTIVASKYQLYLPSEQQLIDEVKKEIDKHEAEALEDD